MKKINNPQQYRILYIDQDGNQVYMRNLPKKNKETSCGKVLKRREIEKNYDYVGIVDSKGEIMGARWIK
jgi:hypothetical protein